VALTRSRGARIRAHLADDDVGRAGITVMLALMTLITAIVVALQFDAADTSAAAERQADAAALRRSESDARGNGDQIVDYGLYRAWYEEVERANWAAERGNAIGAADPAQYQLLAALNQADNALAEWVRTNTVLLQPPFQDPKTYEVDFIGYVASRAADSIRAGEQFSTANSVADANESRSATFVALLTVLAASLFFLGLAATLSGRPRRMLIVVGLAFALVGTTVSVVLAVQPTHRVEEPAIDAVVRATVEELQGPPRGSLVPTTSQLQHSQAGIAAAAEAVALDPAYPGAWRVQGESNLGYATAMYFSTEHPDVSATVARSIEGYERVLRTDQQDFTVPWNLGWAKYLAGDLQGSMAATDAALRLTPDRFTLYLNRALVQLAQGDPAAAKATVETGLQVAAQANLGSQGAYFAQSDFELGRLAELRPNEASTLLDIRRRLREADVSMVSTGSSSQPAPTGSLTIGSLQSLGLQADGSLSGGTAITRDQTLQPKGLAGYRITLAAKDVGSQVVALRVRLNGLVDHGYSQLWSWNGAASAVLDLVTPYGHAGFDVNPGRYEIEVYLGGHLADTFTLTVAAPAS
jgi:hypothetical protein